MSFVLDKLRVRRFYVLALLLAAFAQFAMVTHEVLDEHSLGEHCEVCVAQDRLDDTLGSVSSLVTVLAGTGHYAVATSCAFVSAAAATVRNRGPPLL